MAMRELDANSDGKIEYPEFVKWFIVQDPERQGLLMEGRGNVFTIGSGLRVTLTAECECRALLLRLEEAEEDWDCLAIKSGLTAAIALVEVLPEDGVPRKLMEKMQFLQRSLKNDEELRMVDRLYRQIAVREAMQRLWDLLVIESQLRTQPNKRLQEGCVTHEAYQEVHMRLGVAVSEGSQGIDFLKLQQESGSSQAYGLHSAATLPVLTSAGSYAGRSQDDGTFDETQARQVAGQDWNEDIMRFSESSHATAHLEQLRTHFRRSTQESARKRGFEAIFRLYDDDDSGTLDVSEFESAVRKDLKLDAETCSGDDIRLLFSAIDTDGTGTIDAQEFVEWLWSKDSTRGTAKLVDNRRRMQAKKMRAVKAKFHLEAADIAEKTGWSDIFSMYDADGSGELDPQEWLTAVRTECKVSEEVVTDSEINEMFTACDSDADGGIDIEEMLNLMHSTMFQGEMTKEPFFSSIFELAQHWVEEECYPRDASKGDIKPLRRLYVQFVDGLFAEISDPVNGHTRDEQLSDVPVVDKHGEPNFRLKPLDVVLWRAGMGPLPDSVRVELEAEKKQREELILASAAESKDKGKKAGENSRKKIKEKKKKKKRNNQSQEASNLEQQPAQVSVEMQRMLDLEEQAAADSDAREKAQAKRERERQERIENKEAREQAAAVEAAEAEAAAAVAELERNRCFCDGCVRGRPCLVLAKMKDDDRRTMPTLAEAHQNVAQIREIQKMDEAHARERTQSKQFGSRQPPQQYEPRDETGKQKRERAERKMEAMVVVSHSAEEEALISDKLLQADRKAQSASAASQQQILQDTLAQKQVTYESERDRKQAQHAEKERVQMERARVAQQNAVQRKLVQQEIHSMEAEEVEQLRKRVAEQQILEKAAFETRQNTLALSSTTAHERTVIEREKNSRVLAELSEREMAQKVEQVAQRQVHRDLGYVNVIAVL
jgi:Ca2+-binding EF-hand superfamily protein